MTLSELLHKVSFDEIAPFLSKSYTEENPLAWFKMHYDYLCHLVPSHKSEKDYKIKVDIIPQNASEPNEPRIAVSAWLDGNPWEEYLGREMVIEDCADISLAEIAACCI